MNTIPAGEQDAAATQQEIASPGARHRIEYRLPSREMIERRAYEIWLRHGCPSGTAFYDWLAAEAELRSVRRPR